MLLKAILRITKAIQLLPKKMFLHLKDTLRTLPENLMILGIIIQIQAMMDILNVKKCLKEVNGYTFASTSMQTLLHYESLFHPMLR